MAPRSGPEKGLAPSAGVTSSVHDTAQMEALVRCAVCVISNAVAAVLPPLPLLSVFSAVIVMAMCCDPLPSLARRSTGFFLRFLF
jgi:hypothetical protein